MGGSVRVDTRIIATSNKDLLEEIEKGNFREDLYYRLNVIPIYIPQLSERPEDIPALAQAFLIRHSDGQQRTISPAAMQRLVATEWRGNGCELENTIERAIALSEARELQVEDLHLESIGAAGSVEPVKVMLHQVAHSRLALDEVIDLYIDEVMP